MIVIKPVPFVLPKIDKRAADSVMYKFDCTSLLDTNELITSITTSVTEGYTIMDARARLGNTFEFRLLDTIDNSTSMYTDILVDVKMHTTFNNIRTVPISFRVHK